MQGDPAYYNTVDQIFHADWTIQKLARGVLLRRAVEELWPGGHPTRLVQVAGTSGKGSTARFLEAMLGTVAPAGAYVNPHVFDYRERFSVGGTAPEPADVTAAWEGVVLPYCLRTHVDRGVTHTFAEVGILLALTLFERAGVEWAAMETGLGGRYAQLTALDAAAAVLTNVGDDHLVSLGRERWQRAMDKAGIARPGRPLLTGESDPETLEWITALADHAGAELVVVGDEAIEALTQDMAGFEAPPIGALVGSPVQLRNAAVALATAQAVAGVHRERAVPAMNSVVFTGRFSEHETFVFADIAHNPDKVASLAADVEERYRGVDCVFVVGLSGERDAASVLGPLLPLATAMVVVTPPYRGRPAEEVAAELLAAAPGLAVEVASEPQRAIEIARQLGDGVVVVTGSTYAVDAVLNPDPYLRHLNGTMGWRFDTPVYEPGKGPGR